MQSANRYQIAVFESSESEAGYWCYLARDRGVWCRIMQVEVQVEANLDSVIWMISIHR